MNDVLDICRYIINYSNEKDYGVSNLKLQKLLYFIQVYFLICKKKPCFKEKIEAWGCGPIVPVAYNEFKEYGSTDIPTIDTYIEFNKDNPWKSSVVKFNDNCITEEDKTLIKNVVDKLSKHTATELTQITLNQRPWKETYKEHERKEMTIELLKNYFGVK